MSRDIIAFTSTLFTAVLLLACDPLKPQIRIDVAENLTAVARCHCVASSVAHCCEELYLSTGYDGILSRTAFNLLLAMPWLVPMKPMGFEENIVQLLVGGVYDPVWLLVELLWPLPGVYEIKAYFNAIVGLPIADRLSCRYYASRLKLTFFLVVWFSSMVAQGCALALYDRIMHPIVEPPRNRHLREVQMLLNMMRRAAVLPVRKNDRTMEEAPYAA